MDEQRTCAHCGAELVVDRRARTNHQYCRKPPCQRERRRRNQLERRRSKGRRSAAGRKAHAAAMRDFRATHPEYVERERLQRKARRIRNPASPTRRRGEAGSNLVPATVYVEARCTRLHFVDPTGDTLTLDLARPLGSLIDGAVVKPGYPSARQGVATIRAP